MLCLISIALYPWAREHQKNLKNSVTNRERLVGDMKVEVVLDIVIMR